MTFAARWCSNYTDIYANRARNDIVESLENLGQDTQYGESGARINPIYEDAGNQALAPAGPCHALPGWEFTLGTGIRAGP